MKKSKAVPEITLDPLVVVSYEVRLPGAESGLEAFEQMLFEGRSSIDEVPVSRFDRDLYFAEEKGLPGKAYTTLGGCVDPGSLRKAITGRIEALGNFDLTHKHFADVASFAWERLGAAAGALANRCGVFVGHSGGTERGGDMVMSALAESIAEHLRATPGFSSLPMIEQTQIKRDLVESIQRGRPNNDGGPLDFHAYSAASLVARLLGLKGPRSLVDGACASSLIALQHAMHAIQLGRMDAAIVGGATFNSVDNLILFSQSQACSTEGSTPFDADASGLISSEGYVAIVVTKQSIAEQLELPIHGVISSVGLSTDGRGKSLWAPRTEGQQLAIRRGYASEEPLSVDYQEAHATSTQLGDATELQSLAQVMQFSHRDSQASLRIGSVKSNIGHTLEAAGLVGLVKVLISLRRSMLPPSIGVSNRTPYFEWAEHSLELVERSSPWPKSHKPRRAAVNSFGIGGINAHAVVEEYVSGATAKISVGSATESLPSMLEACPLAIVGRGVVLAGAKDVKSLAKLLQDSRSHLRSAPADRWPGKVGLKSLHDESAYGSPTNVGGYIVDYQFDGRPYRIPPKQIERANPTQMMLLDAVDQARREWKRDLDPDADRGRVGVVIGSVFGGEFSNHLQIGLRIPEIIQKLRRALKSTKLNDLQRSQMEVDFNSELLKRYPALLDETGSFTASTLASRIAKTFDWMGGACAVDADDASGMFSLWIASQWLRSGQLDTVICGIAQRSLDVVAYEQLDRRGRLVRSGRPEDIPADCSKILPGEGVATVVLKRLDDALAERLPIFGIIDHIEQREIESARGATKQNLDHRIISRLGYLIGGHAVVRTIAETIQWAPKTEATTEFVSTTEDNISFEIGMRSPSMKQPEYCNGISTNSLNDLPKVPSETTQASKQTTRLNERSLPVNSKTYHDSKSTMLTLRIEAKTEAEFERQFDRANAHVLTCCGNEEFAETSVYCAAVIGQSESDLIAGLMEIQKAWKRGVRVKAFARHHAFLVDRTRAGNRVAWVFPGQGSQYPAVPAVIQQDSHAAEFISRFDDELSSMGISRIAQKLTDPEKQLGKNIWWTQAWVLAVTSTFADSLTRRGHVPDIVMGHSFGEWSAALHAGVLNLSQAIHLAKVRSEAVSLTAREPGKLLSVRGEPSDIRAVLSKNANDCEITHFNSRDQVVIAGNPEQIQSAKAILGEAGFASVVIPVPAAFHTRSMIDAQRILSSVVDSQTLRPPRFGFLSATTSTYLGEPRQIAEVLVKQLTQPVLYEPAASRLIRDQCGLLLEVGPSDVLTRLNEAISDNDSLCYAIDHCNGTHEQRMLWIDLAVQCVSGRSPSKTIVPHAPVITESLRIRTTVASDVEVIDVTGRGRRSIARAQQETLEEPLDRIITNDQESSQLGTGNDLAPDAVCETAAGSLVQHLAYSPEPWSLLPTDSEMAKTIETLMIDFVIDQTGYSPDLIDLDADLESELAIDSIKKAQLLGELQEQFDLHDVELGRLTLSDFTNLRSIRDFVVSHLTQNHADEILSEPKTSVDNVSSGLGADYLAGFEIGAAKKKVIRNQLRDRVDHFVFSSRESALAVAELAGMSAVPSDSWLEGVSAGAGVHVKSLRSAHRLVTETIAPATSDRYFPEDSFIGLPAAIDPKVPPSGTCRFALGVASRPHKPGMPASPLFHGAALILGDNAYADAIEKTLSRFGIKCHRIGSAAINQVDSKLDTIWAVDETPHLFITTPHDKDALLQLEFDRWRQRRAYALSLPYRVCQRWMQRMIDSQRMSGATVVSVTRNGSAFGFEPTADSSPESGGIAGLTKAMLIEAWMRGFRETPMKVIEPTLDCDPVDWANAMLQELAVPTHDQEIVLGDHRREAVRAWYAPLPCPGTVAESKCRLTRGGVWIVSGGGRGITAFASLALAEQYDLKLVLLGTAEHPDVSEELHDRAIADRSAVRREVMQTAQSAGSNPIEAWRKMEKAIEIDSTLREAKRRGIEVIYRCVDVSDVSAVGGVLEEVRQRWGAIRGVLHGAGSGQDARFDRKRPEKVDQCIGSKVDGCISLAQATANDPLEWFIGFGSISGRFGANGHTDYSLANDMLAKCIGRLRADRPDVRCVTFHWHAWGDIGMAAKPEAKLALEMIGMQFMPAAEGLGHFMNEIAYGGDMAEVLITDRNYVRKFFPDVHVNDNDSVACISPLLDAEEEANQVEEAGVYRVQLDPVRDRFLSEHRISGRPTLPVVIAIEMMAESARNASAARRVIRCRDVLVHQAIKFVDQEPRTIEIAPALDGNQTTWRIKSDVRRRDGRLVEEGKVYFEACVDTASDIVTPKTLVRPDNTGWDFQAMQYPSDDTLMYHGPSLQTLRSIAIQSGAALGKIATPSPSQLAGEHRSLCGWVFPVAVFDGLLYTAGVLAYHLVGRPSLPIAFTQIDLGRLPDPGEPLWVHVREVLRDDRGMTLDADLGGLNNDQIISIRGYRLGWIS